MEYVLYPTERDILHFGKGHDDNPPGRGSGRFAFGSGKRPKQHINEKEQKKEPKTKEEIIRSSKAGDILSIQSELSTNELQDAANRCRLNEELKGYNAKQVRTKWDKMNDRMNKFNDIVRWSKYGAEAWNVFAATYNAAISSDKSKKPLPKITLNSGGDGKKKDKKGA